MVLICESVILPTAYILQVTCIQSEREVGFRVGVMLKCEGIDGVIGRYSVLQVIRQCADIKDIVFSCQALITPQRLSISHIRVEKQLVEDCELGVAVVGKPGYDH